MRISLCFAFCSALGLCLDYDLMLMTILMPQAWLHSCVLSLCYRVNQALLSIFAVFLIFQWGKLLILTHPVKCQLSLRKVTRKTKENPLQHCVDKLYPKCISFDFYLVSWSWHSKRHLQTTWMLLFSAKKLRTSQLTANFGGFYPWPAQSEPVSTLPVKITEIF